MTKVFVICLFSFCIIYFDDWIKINTISNFFSRPDTAVNLVPLGCISPTSFSLFQRDPSPLTTIDWSFLATRISLPFLILNEVFIFLHETARTFRMWVRGGVPGITVAAAPTSVDALIVWPALPLRNTWTPTERKCRRDQVQVLRALKAAAPGPASSHCFHQ